jgi:alkylation response protein AidB-like acyl-CoA dehydrogenase
VADPLDAARGIAEELLFPRALETDALPVVPVENLDALADAGLYGLTGPTEAGGLGADFGAVCAVLEALASGCLTTAFVFAQHLGAVHAVASSETPALADEWLRPLCSGARRAGLALAGALPGPPLLRAEPSDGAWSLTGAAPWVSGIGRVDVIHTAARTAEGDVVWLLADAADPAVRAELLGLVAVGATATARLEYDGFRVGADRVTSIVPHEEGPPNAQRSTALSPRSTRSRCRPRVLRRPSSRSARRPR